MGEEGVWTNNMSYISQGKFNQFIYDNALIHFSP